jgi:hypothetical protein
MSNGLQILSFIEGSYYILAILVECVCVQLLLLAPHYTEFITFHVNIVKNIEKNSPTSIVFPFHFFVNYFVDTYFRKLA